MLGGSCAGDLAEQEIVHEVSGDVDVVVGWPGVDQGRHVSPESGIKDLRLEICNGSFRCETGWCVGGICVEDVDGIEVQLGEGEPEVEQVPPLLALEEGPDLGRDEFGRCERADVCLA